jgi:hypothetical protein
MLQQSVARGSRAPAVVAAPVRAPPSARAIPATYVPPLVRADKARLVQALARMQELASSVAVEATPQQAAALERLVEQVTAGIEHVAALGRGAPQPMPLGDAAQLSRQRKMTVVDSLMKGKRSSRRLRRGGSGGGGGGGGGGGDGSGDENTPPRDGPQPFVGQRPKKIKYDLKTAHELKPRHRNG